MQIFIIIHYYHYTYNLLVLILYIYKFYKNINYAWLIGYIKAYKYLKLG